MSNLDRTGPEAKGPLTGRRRGRCGGNKNVETEQTDRTLDTTKEIVYDRDRGGRPYGGGRGQGFGRRRRGLGNK